MVEGPRPVRPSEYESLLKLVNRTFIRAPGARGMESLFPWHLGRDNAKNLWVMVENGRVVSHLGTNKRSLAVLGVRIPVVLMSSICTDPDYRGQGLASRLIATVRHRHEREGFDLYFISGDRDLYRRIGAAPVGRQLRYVLAPRALKVFAHPEVSVRPAEGTDLQAIASLHAREPVRIVRPFKDFRTVFRAGWAGLSPGRFYVVEADRKITAYFVAGVTRKHGGPPKEGRLTVVEMAGSRTDLLAALYAACGLWRKRRVELSVSPHDRDAMALLAGRHLDERRVPVYDSIAILNLERLLQRLRPLLLKRAGAAARGLEGEEALRKVALRRGRQRLECSRDTMARLLFGEPHRDRPPGLRVEGLLGRAIRSAFPLPLANPGISYV
jgi:predicted N-acetyltransferase YhbS